MRKNKLLVVWRGMRNRCYNVNQKSYKDYGGRGIKVCDRWLGENGFSNFLNDMGEPPVGYSIERVNNDGDYEPSNCKWANRAEQVCNKRNSKHLTANGETKTMAEWARILGCQPSAILYRLKKGMSEEMAVTMPIPERPNSKLTLAQAIEIRKLYPEFTMQALANKFNVSKKTILNILHEKIFKEV